MALFKPKQHTEENKTQPHFQPLTESAECINRKVFWVVFCRAEFRIPAYSRLNCMEKSRHTQSADSLPFFWSAKNLRNSQWQSNTPPVWRSTQVEHMTNVVLTRCGNPGTTKQSRVDPLRERELNRCSKTFAEGLLLSCQVLQIREDA